MIVLSFLPSFGCFHLLPLIVLLISLCLFICAIHLLFVCNLSARLYHSPCHSHRFTPKPNNNTFYTLTQLTLYSQSIQRNICIASFLNLSANATCIISCGFLGCTIFVEFQVKLCAFPVSSLSSCFLKCFSFIFV